MPGRGEEKFRRDNGGIVGHSYSVLHLQEATPERIAEVRKEERARRLVHALEGVSWSALPLEILESVATLALSKKSA